MAEQVRVRARVRGRVQMVGFRAFVIQHAAGLRGTVANRSDGSLECLIEGPAQLVEGLVDKLRTGPAHARVAEVEVERHPYGGDLPPMTVSA